MAKILTFLCPLASACGIVALLALVLRPPSSQPLTPSEVRERSHDTPEIRLLEISDRMASEAWRDDFVEATTGDAVLWIDRPASQPWREEIRSAARLTNLSPALLAEVVGMESGFHNVHNARSTAFGFGQQIAGNQIMKACRLDRSVPAQSILGAALELRWDLDHHDGSLERALDAYGTTAMLRADLRRKVLARMQLASQRL